MTTMVTKALSAATLALTMIAGALPAAAHTTSATHVALNSSACAVRERAAEMRQPAIFDAPVIVSAQGLQGMAVVEIALDGGGKASDAQIITSSGNPLLDKSALHVAQTAAYAPAVHDCLAQGGQYAVEVEFAQ